MASVEATLMPIHTLKTEKFVVKKPTSVKQKVADEMGSAKSVPGRGIKQNQTLIISTLFKQFTLTYSESAVAIKGYKLDLSLQRKECNAHIINRFYKEMSDFIQKWIKSTLNDKQEKGVSVQIEEERYFFDNQSEAGNVLLSLPNEILRMKWEEKFNCKKDD